MNRPCLFLIIMWAMHAQLPNDRVIVLRGLGSRPGQVIALCFWEKNFNLTVPLSTQEYKEGLNGAMAFTANG